MEDLHRAARPGHALREAALAHLHDRQHPAATPHAKAAAAALLASRVSAP
jgi:hypothetical protein